VNQKEDKTK